MSEPERTPLSDVDLLVQAYLAKQTEQIDGAAGLARVRAAMSATATTDGPRRHRGFRFLLAATVAASVALAFFGGWYLGPTQVSAKELVAEVKRVHNQPLSRCYLVEMQRVAGDDDDLAPIGKVARQVRIWTRGDRFWVEMRPDGGSEPAFVWGLADNGSLWAALDSHRGVRVPLEQAPRPLQRLAEVYTLNVDTLLSDVLHDCTLTEEPATPSRLTRVVNAEPRTDRTRLWLGRATLEIDNEAKVVRRMTIVRNLLGNPLAKITFTLVDTKPDDDAKYQLEGHLVAPSRVYEGNIEPRVKLELLGRWLGVGKKGRGAKDESREQIPVEPAPVQFKDIEGRTQTPLSPPDKKATVLFFLLPDCPISNAYAPEIQRICSDYEAKKILGFVVLADPDVTVPQARKYAKEFGFKCPLLLDPNHVLVKKAGATMAPEVAVLAPDQTVLYRGRIDDWYGDYGKRRGEPTQRDLRNALDAVAQGKQVATPTTKVIGCYLPEPSK